MEENSIPWEWVGSPDEPLFTLCGLSRELAQRPSASPEAQREPQFLLAADLLTKQGGNDEDVNSAWAILRASPAKVVNLTGSTERESLRDILRGDRFGMVYLACPVSSSLEFAGVSLEPKDFAPPTRTSPALVFFHNYAKSGDWNQEAKNVASLWPETGDFGIGCGC